MSKKFFRSLLVLALVLGALPFFTARAQEVTLKLWIMPNGPDPAGAVSAEIAAFEAANPGYKVEYEILDWGSAWTRITNAAVSGEGPDVTQLGTTWVGAIDAMDALHHFTDEEIAAIGGKDNFTAASLNTVVRADTTDGAVVSLPWFTDVRAINYRADIFAELGIDPATAFADWDSFTKTLQTIKDAKLMGKDAEGKEFPIYPIAFPGKNDWNVLHNFAPWVWSAGGDLISADLKTATFNDEKSVEGVAFYASLFTSGFTPPDTLELNSAQVDGLLSSGKAAMIVSGPWNVPNSRTSIDKNGWSDPSKEGNLWPEAYAVAEIPAGPAGRYTFVGGSNLGVFKSSANLEGAVKLAQFLVSDSSQARYTQTIGMLPTAKSTLALAEFAGDKDYSVFISAVENGKSYPAIAAWGPIETIMVTNLGALWDDVAGVNGAFDAAKMIPARLAAAAEEVTKALAQ
ncbi:MAG TPA: sugar ABC transporter substrate-binding protein [Aggregatilineales bacterium]|nr:sugar ABC transporter substrate-binding protein [Anaerolineales bacterium]HRE46579.1 sugar ABC transporter substrate-binding protein [Aggregatilineales bacterium]